jgi:hypothetical protein
MPFNNSPANFTDLGNYTRWVNTVTGDLFWNYIVVLLYFLLFYVFRKNGSTRAIAGTCWIMFFVIWPLVVLGLVHASVAPISLGLALASMFLLMFDKS